MPDYKSQSGLSMPCCSVVPAGSVAPSADFSGDPRLELWARQVTSCIRLVGRPDQRRPRPSDRVRADGRAPGSPMDEATLRFHLHHPIPAGSLEAIVAHEFRLSWVAELDSATNWTHWRVQATPSRSER